MTQTRPPTKNCFICKKLCYGYTCKDCKGHKSKSALSRLTSRNKYQTKMRAENNAGKNNT